ncbi:MAG TPA: MBG domain-containing protein [Candidatus Methylomirabilis sp.]|nr:MBG domain-containing protein [Candidatus Methylomirabilis sp.]
MLANYTVTYNTAAFTINKATASVTPNAASKTYGASDPAFTGALSGFLPSDGITATYSRTAGESVAGSPYSISATLSPAGVLANYTVTYNTAAFTINKATASVTPSAASKTYGASDPAFTGTLSGFLPSDGITATYSRTAGESVAGSPYTISATLSPAGVLANYTVTYNTAAFTINKATASVTPSAATKTYGASDPAFTGTLTGFLASDNVIATYGRTAGESVAGSPYTISATLGPVGALANYNVTYNTAAFTIDKASASVTPNAASKTYGAGDPAFTGTLSGFLAADGVTASYQRTAGESVSSYTISASLSPTVALANYTVTYNTALFTITPAPASVTPAAGTKVYGTPDPVLTGTVAGFLAADNVTATYSRTAGEGVAGSPYGISATLSPASVLSNYAITYNTAPFTITPATPVLTWANPADITFPTPLGDVQLNATANVPGAFVYTPPAGTVLSPGAEQPLSVLFTPTDNTDYTTASAQVAINVVQSDVSVSKSTSTPIIQAGESATYSLTVTGNGPGDSSNVVLTDVLPLGLIWTVNGPDASACQPVSPLPGGTTLTCTFGTVGQGQTRTVTLTGSPALSWMFVPADDGLVGSSAGADYTSGGNLVHVDAFVGSSTTDNGTPAVVLGRNDAGGETGIGVCASVSGAACTDPAPGLSASNQGLLRLDLGAAGASLSDLMLQVHAGQPEDTFRILTSASETLDGATLLHSGTSADNGVGIALGIVHRYLFVQAGTGTVFVQSLGAATCGTVANTAAVTATGDRDASNNSAGPVGITVHCPTAVTASITAADKGYDGTTAATITNCTLTGVAPADAAAVSCTATDGAFDTPSVGAGKPVTALVSLTGPAASQYVLAVPVATTNANITPAPASVTPAAASKTYGAADPALTGTLNGFLASDGITASYGRTAGESVAGSPYTISATLSPGAALANYAVTYNTASFTINQASASVTPNPASKTYGAADPGLTGTLTGFLAGDGVTATYSRTAGESVAGGPYAISATLSPAGALANYTVTYNTASFTINKATAAVTPNAASKTYGAADPTLTGTLSGFLAADNMTASYTRTAGESVAGSPYTISTTLNPPSALANYAVTYNTASFTINKATAAVTPNAASKTYGAADPVLTGTLAGFLASDNVTATYSRTSGETVAGSPYTISATLSPAAVLGNYTVTYNTANFTIGKATASVTPAARSKTYGAADPVLTGTLTGFLASDNVTATYSRTSGEAVAGSPYTISATLSPASVLGNYTITYSTAAFSITQAPASVTPNAASKVAGTPDPPLTGTLAGFVAADGVTATYTRAPGENVGNYTVSATLSPTSVLGNYSITYNTASLTIVGDPALSLTKTANPTTYAYAGQTIVYTYVVQNTGVVTITGPFTVTDDKLGVFQCGTATSLAPGDSTSCTASYVTKATDLGTVPSLPTGVVANINTGAWLQGVMSTQDTTVTGAAPGVPNGVYPGWCIQDHVIVDLHNQPGTLYSTVGGSLPADVAGLPWNKINYVLNHKIWGSGRTQLQFFEDVQTAIWLLLGEQNPDFGKSAQALQMVANANANPNYVPGPGNTVAVIVYSDGMGTNPNSIQESILEMIPFQQITNHATVTGQYSGSAIQSNVAQATVTQTSTASPVDTGTYGDQPTASKTVTTSALSTNGPNRVLLAFISADSTSGANTTVSSISGGGLTWQLVVRANGQRGTAEIWRALASSQLTNVTVTAKLSQSVASSMSVIALIGVDTTGTNGSNAIGAVASSSGASGAPTATLTTTRAGSWVFGVGNDWDNAIARTVGPNQALVHQYMPPVNDTYWVQRTIDPAGAAGAPVTLNDLAPTSDRWNLAAAEVRLPQ